MPGRDPQAEAVVLARKARDDAAAMRELAGNPEISDEIVGFHALHGVLRLAFADDASGEVDVLGRMCGPVFERARTPEGFREVHVAEGTVAWPGGADLAPDTLHERIRTGACSQHHVSGLSATAPFAAAGPVQESASADRPADPWERGLARVPLHSFRAGPPEKTSLFMIGLSTAVGRRAQPRGSECFENVPVPRPAARSLATEKKGGELPPLVSQGCMRDPEQHPDDFANDFQAAFARLQIRVETACAAEAAWPDRVAAAIRAALSFAAAHPEDADLLTNRAMAVGREGFERYDRMFDHFAGGLRPGREERPHGRDLPPITDKAMVGGLAGLIAQRLGGRAAVSRLPALAPDAIQFVLTPYLGAEDARRIAAEAG